MLRDGDKSIGLYTSVLQQDYNDVEAMACIGIYNFYDEKPEVAAKYFQFVVCGFFFGLFLMALVVGLGGFVECGCVGVWVVEWGC